MFVLSKVERCVFGVEPDEYLDVPSVIGVFDNVEVGKQSVKNVIWNRVNAWTDEDNQVS